MLRNIGCTPRLNRFVSERDVSPGVSKLLCIKTTGKQTYKLEVLIEKGSAAVSCDANRTKTVCRTVKHMNFFLKVNNIE